MILKVREIISLFFFEFINVVCGLFYLWKGEFVIFLFGEEVECLIVFYRSVLLLVF